MTDVQIGDVIGRRYPWSPNWLHMVVDAENLEDCRHVVAAGLWRVLKRKAIKEREKKGGDA